MIKKLKIQPIIFLTILFFWLFIVISWTFALPYNDAPDECVHFRTAQFFQQEIRLPVAGQESITVIDEPGCFGIAYLSTPYVHYFITAGFINAGNLLGIERDYLAARMISVYFALIFGFFLYKALERVLPGNYLLIFSTYASILFIPQVTFTFSYLNDEAFSLASTAIMLFAVFTFYRLPTDKLREKKYYLLLGLAISLLLLGKSNFYLLLVLPVLMIPARLFKEKKIYWRGIFLIVLVIALLDGWLFVRNIFLYGEPFGISMYKKLVLQYFTKRTYAQAGWTFYDILFKTKWLEETFSSFYGRFGYMNAYIEPVLQWIFRLFVFFGFVGLIDKAVSMKNNLVVYKKHFYLLIFAVLVPINLFISLANSLYIDFQNQGRYLFPVLIPLMILVNYGYFLIFNKKDTYQKLVITIILGSIILNFWSFLDLPKI